MKLVSKFRDPHKLAKEVCDNGWVRLTSRVQIDHIDNEVLELAQSLGQPTPGRGRGIVEHLSPQTIANAKINSLSETYGLAPLPLHTDGAHLLLPPRFIILACAQPGSTPVPTILLRFGQLRLNDNEVQLCESAAFLIRNGRRSFYSSVLDRSRRFVRFDRGCMLPVNRNSETAAAAIAARIADTEPAQIVWRNGDILIVDNWQVLHGRGMTDAITSSDRLLLRVSIQ